MRRAAGRSSSELGRILRVEHVLDRHGLEGRIGQVGVAVGHRELGSLDAEMDQPGRRPRRPNDSGALELREDESSSSATTLSWWAGGS
jgi:hypothetical protein